MTTTPGPDCQEPMVHPYAEHDGQVAKHYAHAREKHPYFCDRIISLSETGVEALIKLSRRILAIEVETGNVEPGDVLECEFYEAMQAYTHGDKAHAVEELYDCIAVLLRTIDVLEGRQRLGRPDTISGNPAGK